MSVNLTNIKKTRNKLEKEIRNLEKENKLLQTDLLTLLIDKKLSCPFCGENFIDETSSVYIKQALKNHFEICKYSPLYFLLQSIEKTYQVFGRKDIRDYILSVYKENFEDIK